MRISVQKYKKSINNATFTDEQIKIIWDFYVTKSLVADTSQKRSIQNDYGKKNIPWKEMLKKAGISEKNIKILPANKIDKTLKKFDLIIEEKNGNTVNEKDIEIDIPKIICLTPFSIEDEEKPKPKCGAAEIVLKHIRNAFAHGNTYFFDIVNVMFEDKNNGIITARIILQQQTLLDWISIIDDKQKYYIIRDAKIEKNNSSIQP